jgi:hypothetical protein
MKNRPDPAASCRCFSAEDACRHALAAYYAASREIEPPPGEPFESPESGPYAGPTDFVDAFLRQVAERIYGGALEAGVVLRFDSIPACPDGLRLAINTHCGPDAMLPDRADFSGPENDSLPLPENPADNQLAGELEC